MVDYGCNFVIYVLDVKVVILCIFYRDMEEFWVEIVLFEKIGDVWYGFVVDIEVGVFYGYCVLCGDLDFYVLLIDKLFIDFYVKKFSCFINWDVW